MQGMVSDRRCHSAFIAWHVFHPLHLQENIDLQSTILSRFDLIFIVKDERSAERDMMVRCRRRLCCFAGGGRCFSGMPAFLRLLLLDSLSCLPHWARHRVLPSIPKPSTPPYCATHADGHTALRLSHTPHKFSLQLMPLLLPPFPHRLRGTCWMCTDWRARSQRQTRMRSGCAAHALCAVLCLVCRAALLPSSACHRAEDRLLAGRQAGLLGNPPAYLAGMCTRPATCISVQRKQPCSTLCRRRRSSSATSSSAGSSAAPAFPTLRRSCWPMSMWSCGQR